MSGAAWVLLSKGPRQGQCRRSRRGEPVRAVAGRGLAGRPGGALVRLLLAAILLAPLDAPSSASAGGSRVRAGEETPRYATLRNAPVNARLGPGEDYKAVWTFVAKGAPVQIVEETEDWRRVCDPEGGLAWVRARSLDARRTVMRIKPSDLPLRKRPADDARIVAVLAARATAALSECRRGWCRVVVDHTAGWIRPGEVWGVDPARQCR